jgi:hypothetical protein
MRAARSFEPKSGMPHRCFLGPRPLRHTEVLRVAAGSCSSQERRAVAMPGTGLGDRSLGACSDDRRIRKYQKGPVAGASRSPLTDSNRRPPPYHAIQAADGGSRWQRFSLVQAILGFLAT